MQEFDLRIDGIDLFVKPPPDKEYQDGDTEEDMPERNFWNDDFHVSGRLLRGMTKVGSPRSRIQKTHGYKAGTGRGTKKGQG